MYEYYLQVEVFWVVTPCSIVVGYRRFSINLRNVGILPQHYTVSQQSHTEDFELNLSLPLKPHISYEN